MIEPGALLERLAPDPRSGPRAERGRTWFHTHGLPSRREEAWHYAPLDDIVTALESAHPAPEKPGGIDRAAVTQLAGDHGGLRVVCVNGRWAPSLCDLATLPKGLWLGGAHELRARRIAGSSPPVDEPADGFHALNWAAGDDVAAVMIDPGVQLDAPVHVVHLTVPGDCITIAHPRTVVRVGRNSGVHVIETYAGLPGPSITNASTRLIVDQRAAVTYHRIQAEATEAIHIGRAAIEQAEGSAVRATSIMTGGDIARVAVDVTLGGVDSTIDLQGLYLPAGHQRHDNVVRVDHAASRCSSTQRFKGVIDDHGRGSFSGHVIVRPGTVGTDANQSNPNLVLSPTAQADTRPWLEILADDVRCAHGASVGRLDHDAIFYLRSRGIPLAESRAMLVAAFSAEVIDAISPASLRDWVAAAAEQPRTEDAP